MYPGSAADSTVVAMENLRYWESQPFFVLNYIPLVTMLSPIPCFILTVPFDGL